MYVGYKIKPKSQGGNSISKQNLNVDLEILHLARNQSFHLTSFYLKT